jgi:hypothetical protein
VHKTGHLDLLTTRRWIASPDDAVRKDTRSLTEQVSAV